MQLPSKAIAAAREELRARLKDSKPGAAAEQRARLRARLERLAELFSWGHVDESAYRRQRAEVESEIAALPDNAILLTFDRNRAVVETIGEALAAASPDRVQELIALVVERVDTEDQRVTGVTWLPSARPFFRDLDADTDIAAAPLWRPRTDSNRRRRP